MTEAGASPDDLRWRDACEGGGEVRRPTSRAVTSLLTSVLLLGVYGFSHLFIEETGHALQPIDRIALAFGIGFLLLALRSMFMVTRLRIEDGELVVRTSLSPWSVFRAPITSVESFDVVSRNSVYRIEAVFRGGDRRLLPVELDPMSWLASAVLGLAGIRARIAPRAHALFLTERLQRMLEGARRCAIPSSPYRM
jgi:hypothetical protein